MRALALLAGLPEWTQTLIYPGDELGTAAVPFYNTVRDVAAPADPPPAVGTPITAGAAPTGQALAAAYLAPTPGGIPQKAPRDYGAVVFVLAAAAGVFLLFRALR